MVVQTTQDVTYILAEVNNRVRTLESKYDLFGERLLVVNQNMIEEYKRILKEMKVMSDELRELKAEITEAKVVVKNIVGELDLFARKESVKVLEKYLNLWSPLNFITEEELNKAIEERLSTPKVKGE